MHVYDEDLLKYDKDVPVRRGCSARPCACSGDCKDIVGMIDKEKYSVFLANFKTLDQFFNENMRERHATEINKVIDEIYIDWPKEGAEKYKIVRAIKDEFGLGMTDISNFMSCYMYKKHDDVILARLLEILDTYNVKYELFYAKE